MKTLIIILAVFVGLVTAFAIFQNFHHPKNERVLGTTTVIKESHKILYVSDQTGNQDIYLMDLQTDKKTNLTNNPSQDMNPQVSPDGKFIIFYSDRDGDNEIYRMRLKDREVMQLTHNDAEDYDPEYSSDGKLIAYKSNLDDKKGDIFSMNANGTTERNLTLSLKTSEEWDPTFTQDGKKIIFVSRTNKDPMTDELGMMNVDGSGFKQLTKNNIPDWYPSVHPSKNWLVFISKTYAQNPDDIYMSTVNGDSRTQITSLPGNDADPAWNLSGNKIIFINDQDGDYDLYIMNADGSNPQKLLDTPEDELSPIFL